MGISSVQSLSQVWLFATPWTAAHQASLSITNSLNLLLLMSFELVMPSNHLILCRPLLPPLLLPSIGSFQMSQLRASGDQSFSVSPYSEYWGLISFRMDWLDLLAVQSMETLILQMRSQTLRNTSKVTQLQSSRALIFNFQVLSSFSEIKFSLFYLLNKNNIKSNISLNNINNMSADFLTKPAKTGFSDYLNFCQFI